MLSPALARADGPFDGTWQEGAMNIEVAVESWGGDCGPRPRSTTAGGGGSFPISQEGDQLTFHLRRQRTTRGCWSENRSVRRVSSTYQAGTWRIVCRTPPDDPRAETGTYTIQSIGNDRLTFRDVSAYDWQLNESRCVATITTTQNFTRTSSSPSAPAAEPAREEPEPRCTAGEPVRIVMRPASADVPPGGQQCFSARVVDAQNCPVRSQRVELSLAAGSPGQLENRCYRASNQDGQAVLQARAGALSAEARVSVHPIDLSDLIARRTESGSVGSGAPSEASTTSAARVSTADRNDRVGLLYPLLALALALVLVIVAAVFFVRRSRPRTKRKPAIAGLRGIEIPEPESETEPTPAGEDLICPDCRRGYPPGTARCSQDGAALVAYSHFVSGKGPGGRLRENVCPTCGEKYPPHVKFCGKDGATLDSGS